MANPESLRQWLESMHYPGAIPTDEELEYLCTETIGPVFQQLIDKVRPKEEISNIKKNLVLNRIRKLNKNEGTVRSSPELPFETKHHLTDQLKSASDRIDSKQESLVLLKKKINEKTVKTRTVEQRIRQNKREETVIRAKRVELQNELGKLDELNRNHRVASESDEDCTEMIENAVTLINGHVDANVNFEPPTEYKHSLPTVTKLPMTATKQLAISTASKTVKHPTTVPKNPPSTVFKHFGSSVSGFPELSNNDNNDVLCTTLMGDRNLQKIVNDICLDTDKNVLWQTLNDIKIRDDEKFIKFVSESKESTLRMNPYDHMESLYQCHIENELHKTENRIKLEELEKTLEAEFENEQIEEAVILEAIDNGLDASIPGLKSRIDEVRNRTVDNSDLDEALNKFDEAKNEMNGLKAKIEGLLRTLPECPVWIDTSRRRVREVVTKPFTVIENDIIDNLSSTVHERFCNLPIDCNGLIDCWSTICNCPELMEIVGVPNVFIDRVSADAIDNVTLLQKLETYEKERNQFVSDESKLLGTDCERPDRTVEKLLASVEVNEKTSKVIDSLLSELDISVNHPFNEFILSRRWFNKKPLMYYVQQYDNLYKQLK